MNNYNKSKLNFDIPTSRSDDNESETELNEPTPRNVEQQLDTVS